MNGAVWIDQRLGDVASMGSGGTPARNVKRFFGGGIPWVSITDMTTSGKYVTATATTLTEEGLNASAARLYEPNVILYAMYASLGEVCLAVGRVSSSQAILGIHPNAELDREFLYYQLQSIKPLVKKLGQQGTQSNLNAGMVRDFRIMLPPLPEQRSIARAMADADELIGTLERVIAKKQAIKHGMIQKLVTGKTRLPNFTEPWRKVGLGDLGTFLKGHGVKRDDVRSSGIPCIRYGELYTAFENYTRATKSFVGSDTAATALPIQSGDLLFAGSGETREEIGVCVAYIGEPNAVAGGDIVVLRGRGFNPIFLATLLNTHEVTVQKARAGQGDAVVHINSRALADIAVALPPMNEQDVIAEVMVDADREIALFRDRLAKARAIKTGMTQELLTGRTRLPVGEVAA